METHDRTDGHLPARPAHFPPAARAAPADDYADPYSADAGPRRKKFSFVLAWRAFRRYWWQGLLLWAALAAGLVTLAYYRVKPSYEALAQLRIEPSEDIFTQKNFNHASFVEYRNSQVSLITNPNVLSIALYKHPELYQYPLLRNAAGAQDADGVIRHTLQVVPVRETSQIQVSMTSTLPEEAAAFVNTVVDAYIEYAQDVRNQDAQARRKNLEVVRREAENEVKLKRGELEQLREKLGNASLIEAKELNRFSAEQYGQFNQQLVEVSIRRIAVQGQLEILQGEKAGVPRADDPKELDEAVAAAFYAEPAVAQLDAQLAKLKLKLAHEKSVARNEGDYAIRYVQRQADALEARLKGLWKSMEPRLRRRLANGTGDDETDRAISLAKRELASLGAQEQALKDKLSEMTLKNDRAGNEALKLGFVKSDLARAELVLDQVQAHLKQLDFESRGALANVRLDFKARPMLRPSTNHRLHAMAAAPVLAWFAVLGLLGLIELRSGRVADLEDLPSRARLQVLGVVPPLPRVRPLGGALATRGDGRAQRELAAFVQSLDHLRVALCARPDPWGRNRHCVLITSACGSEGKTTLAAQLAERCVNAGLLTLLIDADLRNPSLSRMLDADEQAGLINVLRGDLPPEDAIVVIEDAGGFHFLPAGAPRVDPSRLLHGDALGHFLAQARESFDMIIVDAPPVLPVPDALTIGRWTDGAVLAVRYDASRFNLVEQANRRLAHVGVPVLGAVVNGVQPQGAYGGYYAYGGHSPAEPAV